jgi:hypothetical protein
MGENYADLQRVKAAINSTGLTVDDAKLEDYAGQVDAKLGAEFIYILGDTLPFQGVPQWFTDLATDLLEAFYWFKENGEKEQWNDAWDKVIRLKENMFMNPPAMTR